MKQSKDLMAQGEYEAALKKNREILQLFPAIGDQALFHIGLIYAHPKYKGRNYKISLRNFQKIINEFTESDLRNQAEIWSLFLNKVIRKDKSIREQNKEISTLRKNINSIEKEMEAGIKERDELRKEIDGQNKEIEELHKQIEQLKKIDLTIEEKKRKSLP